MEKSSIDKLNSPEFADLLLWPAGWAEILNAPDALDYQMQLESLAEISQAALRELGEEWAEDTERVMNRWQRAIEMVATTAITPEDLSEMNQAEIVETGIATLTENLDQMWEVPGVAFTVGNMFTGEDIQIDLRNMPEPPDTIDANEQ